LNAGFVVLTIAEEDSLDIPNSEEIGQGISVDGCSPQTAKLDPQGGLLAQEVNSRTMRSHIGPLQHLGHPGEFSLDESSSIVY
jgi:hypothetical protein